MKNIIILQEDEKLDGNTLIEILNLDVKTYAPTDNQKEQKLAIIETVLLWAVDQEKYGEGVENRLIKLGLI